MTNYSKNLSMPIVRRLPKYRKILVKLLNEKRDKIASEELAQMTGLTSSQIRHDLNALGAFGYQGYGYKVEEVLEVIERVLGCNLNYSCIVVGMDNRGVALSKDQELSRNGFIVKAMFDNYPHKIEGLPKIQNMKNLEEYLKNNPVEIAILTVDDSQAQQIANVLEQGGVKAILNFTNMDLKVDSNVIIENASVRDKFYVLSYLLSESE